MKQTLTGLIALPPDLSPGTAASVRIEIHDTSLSDAPSVVVSTTTMRNIALAPGGTLPFSIEAPPATVGRALTLRIHISLDGSEQVRAGDLLTTSSVRVPEDVNHIPVTVVR